jgi:cytochrome P450
MAVMEETEAAPTGEGTARCPVDHSARSYKKSIRPVPDGTAPLEQDAAGVWHVRGFAEARAVLRSAATRQAGFNAELVVSGSLTRHPILYQEGKVHQDQRAKTARFFTPKTVSTQYRAMMEALADELIAGLRRTRRAVLYQLSLALSMQVVARVVGLTESSPSGLARRLDSFFDQATAPKRKGLLGRALQILNLRRMLLFYLRDVRPAIQAHRRAPREDVISHLLAQGYRDPEILTECVTYAAAGMATTREFISMAAWHFLENPPLRARYLVAPDEERVAILHEILRLEPVVGHLYRRTTGQVPVPTGDAAVVIPEGALVDIHVETVNVDESVVGADPLAVCPARPLHGDRINPMLMSFGDGAHRCPGAYLSVQETDIFLQRLLALPNLRIERLPTLIWNDLTAGYELRHFVLALDPA